MHCARCGKEAGRAIGSAATAAPNLGRPATPRRSRRRFASDSPGLPVATRRERLLDDRARRSRSRSPSRPSSPSIPPTTPTTTSTRPPPTRSASRASARSPTPDIAASRATGAGSRDYAADLVRVTTVWRSQMADLAQAEAAPAEAEALDAALLEVPVRAGELAGCRPPGRRQPGRARRARRRGVGRGRGGDRRARPRALHRAAVDLAGSLALRFPPRADELLAFACGYDGIAPYLVEGGEFCMQKRYVVFGLAWSWPSR